MATKLPKSMPDSFRFQKKDPGALVKSATHHKKAERLRKGEQEAKKAGDPTRPHLQYLERYQALLHAVKPIEEKTRKEFLAHLGQEKMGPHELIGHLIAQLPRPRLELIFKDERIGTLNRLLGRRPLSKIIDDNESLDDLDIKFKDFVMKKRDLKFTMALQTYKASQALALYFTVIRYAADPKAKKKAHLVSDQEVLDVANAVLREVAAHIVEDMQARKDEFFVVNERKERAIAARPPPRGTKV